MMRWDSEAMQALVAGAIGGMFLCLGRFALTYMRIQSPEPNFRQLLKVQLPLLFVLAILGGGLAWLTLGVSGAFLTGLGALGFILLVTNAQGNYQSEVLEDDDESADNPS